MNASIIGNLGLTEENTGESKSLHFLLHVPRKISYCCKTGADSHDNERVVRPEHHRYLAGGKRNLKIYALSPLVICSSGAKIFYADFCEYFNSISLLYRPLCHFIP